LFAFSLGTIVSSKKKGKQCKILVKRDKETKSIMVFLKVDYFVAIPNQTQKSQKATYALIVSTKL